MIERKTNIIKEMEGRGYGIEDLNETDWWVNDATRKDINELVDKYDIVGLKLDDKIITREELKDIYNFGVNYIFLKNDEDQVKEWIAEYNRTKTDEKFLIQYYDLLKKLEEIAIYSCVWV